MSETHIASTAWGRPVLLTADRVHRRLHIRICFFQQIWQQGDDIKPVPNKRKWEKDIQRNKSKNKQALTGSGLAVPLLK